MADIDDLQAASVVKLVGSDSTGIEQTAVQSTANGAVHANLRTAAGVEFGTVANPLSTIAASLPLPAGAATEITSAAINTNLTNRTSKTQITNGTIDSAVLATAPGGAENGLIVRNIPSGTQIVQQQALTKGTQGANGVSTQELKNAGRVTKIFYSNTFTSATAETLISLTPASDGVTAAAATSFTITSGKRFVIQAVTATIRNATATPNGLVVSLRMTSTGAITTTSPTIAVISPAISLNIAGVTAGASVDFPDGFELSGTMQFGLTQIANAANTLNSVTIIGYEY